MSTNTSNLKHIRRWKQHEPPQMGEDESGDLKTPLIQRYFIKIIQLAFMNSTFERTFEGKHTTFYYWTLCKKWEWFYFLFKTFLENCKKGQRRRQKSKKDEAEEGWNKRERRGEREEEKQEIKK